MSNINISIQELPTVAILSGGLATRLYPVTQKIPKSMIKINGNPFIDYQLKWLKNAGIKKIVLCINHYGEQIVDHVKDGEKYGLIVEYSWDGQNKLGTGGALKNALHLLDNTFFVLYGDSFLCMNLKDMNRTYLKSKMDALLAVYKNNNRWDRSNTIVENNNIVLYNKSERNKRMEYIDYGVSLLSATIFKDQDGIFDLGVLYEKLAIDGNLAAYIAKERFFEIGSKSGLEEFSKYIDSLINS